MKHFKILITFLLLISYYLNVIGQPQQKTVILDEPGFPYVFELDPGESQVIKLSYSGTVIEKEIKLDSVQAFIESNYWFNDKLLPFSYYQFIVELEVGGKQIT